jgi:glutathione S-transferase
MPDGFLHQLRVLGSIAASSLTLWRGCIVVSAATQPPLPLKLYEFEACPHCRAVREALTALHLDAEIYPCPKGGTRFRPEAERLGGKALFPLLVDANTGAVMHESADIIEYLFRTYGHRPVPSTYRINPVRPMFGGLASAVRGMGGLHARPSRPPERMLELWSFEGSPYSRLVRERLSELEIAYVLHNLGKEHWKEAGPAVRRIAPNPYRPREGGKRDAFFKRTGGRVQVPYLEDPNTGEKLFESAAIIDYLEKTYAA